MSLRVISAMRRRIFSRSLSFIFNYFDPEVAVYRGTGIPRALFPSTPFFTLLVILLLILQLPPLLSVQFLPAARFVLFSFHKLTSNFKRNPHLRTDVTHQLSALQGNARTDRFCRSFHSSRPRATATLLKHARVRALVCAPSLGVSTCMRQSAAIIAASTNQNG